MKKINFKLEVFLLIISIVWVIFSYTIPITDEPDYWFARSGAIMVLLSAIIEFRLNDNTFKKIRSTIQGAILTKLPIAVPIQKEQKVISVITHIFIIIGTLIWGYGDLLYKYYQ